MIKGVRKHTFSDIAPSTVQKLYRHSLEQRYYLVQPF